MSAARISSQYWKLLSSNNSLVAYTEELRPSRSWRASGPASGRRFALAENAQRHTLRWRKGRGCTVLQPRPFFCAPACPLLTAAQEDGCGPGIADGCAIREGRRLEPAPEVWEGKRKETPNAVGCATERETHPS